MYIHIYILFCQQHLFASWQAYFAWPLVVCCQQISTICIWTLFIYSCTYSCTYKSNSTHICGRWSHGPGWRPQFIRWDNDRGYRDIKNCWLAMFSCFNSVVWTIVTGKNLTFHLINLATQIVFVPSLNPPQIQHIMAGRRWNLMILSLMNLWPLHETMTLAPTPGTKHCFVLQWMAVCSKSA